VKTLTEYLRAAWKKGRDCPSTIADLPPRAAASAVALATWGERLVADLPALVNLAAWAWLASERAVIHETRPSVARLVAATDLHQLPDAPPALLREPWCVQAQRPERGERLWGDTFALAGYQLDDTHYLISLDGEGAHVVPWRPQWSARDLEAGVTTTVYDPLLAQFGLEGTVPGAPDHAAWAREAVRWAVVYGLLLDAAGAPVRVTAEGPPRERDPRKAREAKAWSVSRVTLTPDGERVVAPPSVGAGAEADLTGRVAAAVTVRAHLKRQRYGEGNALTRWIFVEGYAARRWVAPWSTRVVGAGEGSGRAS